MTATTAPATPARLRTKNARADARYETTYGLGKIAETAIAAGMDVEEFVAWARSAFDLVANPQPVGFALRPIEE